MPEPRSRHGGKRVLYEAPVRLERVDPRGRDHDVVDVDIAELNVVDGPQSWPFFCALLSSSFVASSPPVPPSNMAPPAERRKTSPSAATAAATTSPSMTPSVQPPVSRHLNTINTATMAAATRTACELRNLSRSLRGFRCTKERRRFRLPSRRRTNLLQRAHAYHSEGACLSEGRSSRLGSATGCATPQSADETLR